MYFDFRTFFRFAYISFFKSGDTPAPLTVKRASSLILFFTAYSALQLFNAICLFLDDVLFPDYKKIELKSPVFIVGNFRSGTTFIHRVMAMDEEQFFCFRAWEIIFPAITQKKVLAFFGRIDGMLGHFFEKSINRFEVRFFRNFNKMHKAGLFYPEEDELLLVHIFSSYNLIFFFPFFDELKWSYRFDQDLGPKDRKRVMSFYESCVKRQAYLKGNRARLLSKNPGFSAKVDSLYEYFPGCKIIYMVRNPLDVIPSVENMALEIWNSFITVKTDRLFQEKVYETARYFYDYPLARLDRAPKDAYVVINYEDLVRTPSGAVKGAYERFGLELSQEFIRFLHEEDQKAKGYKSLHFYSLDRFYLTREQIVSDLRHIFDRFGFDTREPSAHHTSQPFSG